MLPFQQRGGFIAQQYSYSAPTQSSSSAQEPVAGSGSRYLTETSGYTRTQVDNLIQSVINMIPSLTTYALKTEIPNLEPYVTLVSLNAALAQADTNFQIYKDDIAALYTQMNGRVNGLDDNIQNTNLQLQSVQATANEALQEVVMETAGIVGLDNRITALESATIDLSPYALKTEIPAPVDLSLYALRSEIPASADLSLYALKTEIPSLDNYITLTSLNAALAQADTNFQIYKDDISALYTQANGRINSLDDYDQNAYLSHQALVTRVTTLEQVNITQATTNTIVNQLDAWKTITQNTLDQHTYNISSLQAGDLALNDYIYGKPAASVGSLEWRLQSMVTDNQNTLARVIALEPLHTIAMTIDNYTEYVHTKNYVNSQIYTTAQMNTKLLAIQNAMSAYTLNAVKYSEQNNHQALTFYARVGDIPVSGTNSSINAWGAMDNFVFNITNTYINGQSGYLSVSFNQGSRHYARLSGAQSYQVYYSVLGLRNDSTDNDLVQLITQSLTPSGFRIYYEETGAVVNNLTFFGVVIPYNSTFPNDYPVYSAIV